MFCTVAPHHITSLCVSDATPVSKGALEPKDSAKMEQKVGAPCALCQADREQSGSGSESQSGIDPGRPGPARADPAGWRLGRTVDPKSPRAGGASGRPAGDSAGEVLLYHCLRKKLVSDWCRWGVK